MSALIFDFDGTIADSLDLAIEIFYEVTKHPRITDPAEIERLRALPLLKIAKEARLSVRQIPRLLIKGRSLMHKHIDEVQTFPGMLPTLRKLHERGDRLFVMSSNSQQNVEHFLQSRGLADYFDGVYGGIGLFSKTRALRKIMHHNALRPAECFYIGDELRDVQAAKRARVRAVAVAWGYNNVAGLRPQKPFALAEKPADLLKLLSSD